MKQPRSLTRFVPRANFLLGDKGRFFATLKLGFDLVTKKKKFSQIRGDVLDLFSLAKAAYRGEYRDLNKKNLVLIVAGLAYLVSPLDMIPDFILGLGFLDDLSILTYIVSKLASELDSYRAWLGRRE